MVTYKHRLPWINDKIRKLMNEQKKYQVVQKRKDSKYVNKYKDLKD